MPIRITAREGENVQKLVRRFRRRVHEAGVLRDLASHEHFTSNRDKRKKKAAASERRRRRDS